MRQRSGSTPQAWRGAPSSRSSTPATIDGRVRAGPHACNGLFRNSLLSGIEKAAAWTAALGHFVPDASFFSGASFSWRFSLPPFLPVSSLPPFSPASSWPLSLRVSFSRLFSWLPSSPVSSWLVCCRLRPRRASEEPVRVPPLRSRIPIPGSPERQFLLPLLLPPLGFPRATRRSSRCRRIHPSRRHVRRGFRRKRSLLLLVVATGPCWHGAQLSAAHERI